jgi:phosphoribosylanthranilate isomerase
VWKVANVAIVKALTYYGGMGTTGSFQIKICGLTSVDDALAAADAGADAIGLNFWPRSKRHVSQAEAWDIEAAVAHRVVKVGVFVNASAEEVSNTAKEVGLDWIQLHGDEPAQLLAEMPLNLRVMRALRCGVKGMAGARDFLAACCERAPDAILIDADAGNSYGGTGQVADWTRIAHERHMIGPVPLILAGGLTPGNVAEAIALVRPDGIDVASGVESAPGHKDAAMMRDFVAAAREAFAKR